MFDFANLLFAGPCNARCYFCIGNRLDPIIRHNNLELFPPRNLQAFVVLIQRYKIKQVVLTGTNTDPQLYRYEAALLTHLREQLPPGTSISLHTNGRLALRKIDTFNQYDRAAISIPTFDPFVYHQMMGVPGPPALSGILERSKIPIKISCLVSSENKGRIIHFLQTCLEIGIRRVVLRKLFGETRSWEQLIPLRDLPLTLKSIYRSNPVYDLKGMEVTCWDFQRSASRSLNLFASGLISSNYRLKDVSRFSAISPGFGSQLYQANPQNEETDPP
jgi:molybdenum cofactor biosynthesis enzyme MoaA